MRFSTFSASRQRHSTSAQPLIKTFFRWARTGIEDGSPEQRMIQRCFNELWRVKSVAGHRLVWLEGETKAPSKASQKQLLLTKTAKQFEIERDQTLDKTEYFILPWSKEIRSDSGISDFTRWHERMFGPKSTNDIRLQCHGIVVILEDELPEDALPPTDESSYADGLPSTVLRSLHPYVTYLKCQPTLDPMQNTKFARMQEAEKEACPGLKYYPKQPGGLRDAFQEILAWHLQSRPLLVQNIRRP